MRLSSLVPALVVAGLIACVPMRICTLPSYEVLARDSKGKPLANIGLFEIYRYYGLLDGEENATARTDRNGRAQFASRHEWRSLASLTIGCVSHFAEGVCGAYHDITGQVPDAREFDRADRKADRLGNRRSLELTYTFCRAGDPWPCAGGDFSEPSE